MPNAKTGTLTMDIARAVKEIKAGKVEYRVDKNGNIPFSVGKISFEEQKLAENIKAVYELMVRSRPSTVKGVYIKNIALSTTMGPGIKISPESIVAREAK
jgi:large subunit ribosomal protein L1